MQVVTNCYKHHEMLLLLNIDTMTVSEKTHTGVRFWRDSALIRLGVVRVEIASNITTFSTINQSFSE